jgi:hypothetical protein
LGQGADSLVVGAEGVAEAVDGVVLETEPEV